MKRASPTGESAPAAAPTPSDEPSIAKRLSAKLVTDQIAQVHVHLYQGFFRPWPSPTEATVAAAADPGSTLGIKNAPPRNADGTPEAPLSTVTLPHRTFKTFFGVGASADSAASTVLAQHYWAAVTRYKSKYKAQIGLHQALIPSVLHVHVPLGLTTAGLGGTPMSDEAVESEANAVRMLCRLFEDPGPETQHQLNKADPRERFEALLMADRYLFDFGHSMFVPAVKRLPDPHDA